jgi:hypothetical protein
MTYSPTCLSLDWPSAEASNIKGNLTYNILKYFSRLQKPNCKFLNHLKLIIYWQRSWLRHYATSRKLAGSIPDEVIGFFNWPNPSSRIMALGSTHSLTEMSFRKLSGSNELPEHKADNLTAIYEPIV